MPDHDLVAYLDGEADAAAAGRLAAALRDDPETRRQALALLRQRVALARILPGLAAVAPRPVPRGRGWWLVAVACAAAAVVAALALGHGGAGRPEAPAGIALADGSRWAAHAVIGDDGAPLTARLADGTRLELAAGSALTVPAPGEPWRLERGGVTVEVPDGAVALRDGIATREAAVEMACRLDMGAVALDADGVDTGERAVTMMAGRLMLSVDGDGSRIRVIAGHAGSRDLLTGATVALAAGGQRWIPTDTAAPRAVEGQAGTIRGTVVAIGEQGRSVTVRTRFGESVFMPLWIGGRSGGLDAVMRRRLASLAPGDHVAITWLWQEHLRVTGLRLIEAPAGGAPAGGDF